MLFDDLSFDLTQAIIAFRRTQKFDWSELSRVGWFSYSFTKGAVERAESFTILDRKRGADGELLPSETLQEGIVTWLCEDCLCYRDLESSVVRYRGEIPSPLANYSNCVAASPDYDVDVECEGNLNLANLNVAHEPFLHTALKTKFTYLQDVCCLADAADLLYMEDVVHFAPGCVSAPFSGEVSSHNALRRTAKGSKLQ